MEKFNLSVTSEPKHTVTESATTFSNYSLDDFLNVALEYQELDHWFPADQELYLIISFSIVMILGSIANLVLCWIICRRGFAQSSRNWYILNLAISDILTIVLCQPFVVVRIIFKNWTFGVIWCKIVPAVQSTYVFVSTLSILALAVDRYKSIMYTSSKTNNRKGACFIISGIWFVSLVLSFPLFLTHEIDAIYGLEEVILYNICTERWMSQLFLTLYTVMVLVIQYLSPVVAIVTLHILICQSLKFRINSREACQMDMRRIRKKLLRHRKNVMLLTSMAASFVVTWLPLTLLNIIADTNHNIFKQTNFPLIHASCLLVSFTSVSVNPVIYGWFNSNFRKDIKNVCEINAPDRCPLYALICRRQARQVDAGLLLYSTVPRDPVRTHTSRDTTVV
ncbi:neuropeptide Y receptor type 6-like [Patella vulgata]|uniref:neuropeptide Y receptor type 6-like n=1 Tax=Patella vulgata TaxID=6465 RepID=UPI00217F5114|nr:neuropeptide Y receptor type 6-like [Patella vulgata]